MMHEISNFKSSIVWPDERDPEEPPTGELVSFRHALVKVVGFAAESLTMADVTESPIETIFGAHLALALRPVCRDLGWEFSVGEKLDADITLQPQYQLGRYRYDFAIRARGHLKPLILIECDGKEFHSSPEQQANDRLKDAAALNAGIRLVRFSGAEINDDVEGCVQRTLHECVSAA